MTCKSSIITINSNKYYRESIKTHFIKCGENYIELVKKYVIPDYRKGDILSISEKVISLCQGRIIYKKDIKVVFWARFLSRFVHVTLAGEAVGNIYKMQLAINSAGILRILLAALCSAVTKLFGIKGVFYKIAGNGISGIDGFCNDAFDCYMNMGILLPVNPDKVCNDIKKSFGIDCMVVDANDLNVEVLGYSNNIQYPVDKLKSLIKDNPAGQANQQTPFILIKKLS
jgi:F420-0:gamma-glutamyl ligase-like protein